MKIQDLLRKDVMLLDLQATEKTAAIEEMIKSLVDHDYVTDFETFKGRIVSILDERRFCRQTSSSNIS